MSKLLYFLKTTGIGLAMVASVFAIPAMFLTGLALWHAYPVASVIILIVATVLGLFALGAIAEAFVSEASKGGKPK